MDSGKLSITDISYLEGVVDEYIVSNNKLISMIRVDGINLDLLDNFGKSKLFEAYGAFLMGIVIDKEHIQNVSTTVKINMTKANIFWKRKYLDIENDDTLSDIVKNKLLNLVAHKCVDIEKIASKSELSTKEHFIVISHKIDNKNAEGIKKAISEMDEKTKKIENIFNDAISDDTIKTEILNAEEKLNILQTFTDNIMATNL